MVVWELDTASAGWWINVSARQLNFHTIKLANQLEDDPIKLTRTDFCLGQFAGWRSVLPLKTPRECDQNMILVWKNYPDSMTMNMCTPRSWKGKQNKKDGTWSWNISQDRTKSNSREIGKVNTHLALLTEFKEDYGHL